MDRRLNSIFIYFLIWISLSIAYLVRSDDGCPSTEGRAVVCYYSSWSEYRASGGRFSVDFINPTMCTHLVYAFAGLNMDGEIDSLDPNLDLSNANGDGNFRKFTGLKRDNPCLKVLLAIGGYNQGSEMYSLMAETEERREEFADRVERWLVTYDFDGLDFDWEYPAQRGGIAEDRENFTLLIKLLQERLNKRKRLVTVAIGIPRYVLDESYEFPALCEASDFIFLMNYDLHYPDITSTQSPVFPEPGEPESRDNINEVINRLLDSGCDSRKIIFGIGSYGRTYTLQNKANTELGAIVDGPGHAGPYTQEIGFLGYNEICEQVNNPAWTITYLEKNMAKVAVKDDQWIGYDDPESVTERTEYAVSRKLGGVMFWSIDTDDFIGYCHFQDFPLIAAANKVLGRVQMNAFKLIK